MSKSTVAVSATKPLDTILLPPGNPISYVTLPTIMLLTLPPPVAGSGLYLGLSLGPVACIPLVLPAATPVDLAPTVPGVMLLVWMMITKCGGIAGAIDKLQEGIDNNDKTDDKPHVSAAMKDQLRSAQQQIKDATALFQKNGGMFPDTGASAAALAKANALSAAARAKADAINRAAEPKVTKIPATPTPPSGPQTSDGRNLQDVIFELIVVGDTDLTEQLQTEVTARIAAENKAFSSDEIFKLAEEVLTELRIAQFSAQN